MSCTILTHGNIQHLRGSRRSMTQSRAVTRKRPVPRPTSTAAHPHPSSFPHQVQRFQYTLPDPESDGEATPSASVRPATYKAAPKAAKLGKHDGPTSDDDSGRLAESRCGACRRECGSEGRFRLAWRQDGNFLLAQTLQLWYTCALVKFPTTSWRAKHLLSSGSECLYSDL